MRAPLTATINSTLEQHATSMHRWHRKANHLRITLNDVIRRQVSAFNGVISLTKVALSKPARVSPMRSDNCSVAKARSYTIVSDSYLAKGIRYAHIGEGDDSNERD